jgi:hypothetical protein
MNQADRKTATSKLTSEYQAANRAWLPENYMNTGNVFANFGGVDLTSELLSLAESTPGGTCSSTPCSLA